MAPPLSHREALAARTHLAAQLRSDDELRAPLLAAARAAAATAGIGPIPPTGRLEAIIREAILEAFGASG